MPPAPTLRQSAELATVRPPSATTGIAGWAVNQADPWERLEVQLFIDGKFVATTTANQSRPDIVSVGWARDEWHGYRFDRLMLRGPSRHQGRVYVLHAGKRGTYQTLQMVGDPI